MPGVFISYRREDTAGYSGRLYDHLSRHFGKAHIFIDIDAIPVGHDFVKVIDERIRACDVMIALRFRRLAHKIRPYHKGYLVPLRRLRPRVDIGSVYKPARRQ
jgi:TIR domain-containing protein